MTSSTIIRFKRGDECILSFVEDIFKIKPSLEYVVVLDVYSSDGNNEKEKILKRLARGIDNNTVIISEAGAYDLDYPLDKYYDSENCDNIKAEEKLGKKPIPYKKAIKESSIPLKNTGFISIDKYIKYITKELFIYPNAIGKDILDSMNANLKRV